VVAGGQPPISLITLISTWVPIGRQALAGDAVVGQDFFLLALTFHEGLGVAQVAHALGAAHGDGLEVLAAHDGADARAAGRTVQVVHHGGKQHAVFTGLADAGDAGQRVLQPFLMILRFPRRSCPTGGWHRAARPRRR
jgi:hypothetical protein